MTVAWTAFGAATLGNTDYVVGITAAGVNKKYLGSQFTKNAANLSDMADAVAAFDNIAPTTTLGDLIYSDGTNNVRLGIGTSAQIMGITAGAPDWIDNPGLLIANNLDDLDDLPTALQNLGLSPTDDVTFDTVVASTSATSTSFISTGLNKNSVTNAITAHSGGGQGSSVALTAAINRVTTVAVAADSVKLPAAIAGRMVAVINAAVTNAMNCFPASGDAINALSANTALSIIANKTVIFFCAVNGIWNSVVTA